MDTTPENAVAIDPDLLEDKFNEELAIDGAVQTSTGNNSETTDEHLGALPTPPMTLRRSTPEIKRPKRLIQDMQIVPKL